MDYSAENFQLWNVIIQFGIIAILVIFCNILRLKIPFIRKSLLPTSVLAGFILLGIKYLNIVKIDVQLLEIITYHGIALGFIALSLRTQKSDLNKNGVRTAINSGALIVSTYLVQAIVGLAISLFLAYTFMPSLFKASGALLPMGYGQGPGQANNIGSTYESLGFKGGQSYGLALAAAGFLVACIGGVIYLNVQNKRGKLIKLNPEQMNGSINLETFQDEDEMPVSQSIDKLSIQVALVLLVYVFTFVVIKFICFILQKYLPNLAGTVTSLLWGFNFIFASLFAILVRNLCSKFKKFNIMKKQYQNNYLLSRISGLFFDVMIICGIAAIDFTRLEGLWIPFIITAVVGGIVTFVYLKFMSDKLFPNYKEEAFLSMFGMLTGTISSGILLVREIDPDFKTPAASNLVSGSGTGIALGFPMLLLVGIAPQHPFITLACLCIYLVILFVIMFVRKKSVSK